MNKPVNFELAKLLKEKWFDELCDKKYIAQCLWQSLTLREKYKNSEIHQNSSDVVAPTIAEVVMWLYEKHGIWISVYSMERSEDWSIYFDYSIKQKLIGLKNISTKVKEFNTPTEAYEAAIEYTLKNLI